MRDSIWGLIGGLMMILQLMLAAIIGGSWFNHIYVSIADERWFFLIVGVIIFPIGIVNGFGLWLSAW